MVYVSHIMELFWVLGNKLVYISCPHKIEKKLFEGTEW